MKIYFTILTIAIALSGCMKENIDNPGQSGKTDGLVFDFSTNTGYTLNCQYDVPASYIVGFDVYTEYPFEANSGEHVIKQGVIPIEKGFTDKNGAYNKTIELPSYVKTVYVFTSYAGVSPRLLVANVVNGQLQTAVPVKPENAPKSSTRTKAGGLIDYNTIQTKYIKNAGTSPKILTLSKWHTAKEGSNPTTLANGEEVKLYGRPVEMSYANKSKFGADNAVNDALPISAAVLQSINTALKGDGSDIPVDPKYLQSGDIDVTKKAELDLIFIQSWGKDRSTLAYYCYETNNPPTSVNDVKFHVVALPNAMEQKMDLNLSSYYDVASMYKGEGVKLKYVDPNGGMHDEFPAGTSVGWVLYCNAYDGHGLDQGEWVMCPDLSKRRNYSNPAFSKTPNTAILRYGDFVVVGFDDGDPAAVYRDYLDVVFNVRATPADAITPGVPDIDVKPEQPEPVAVTKMGMLLYEDLWPYQGDFDMNDVVVKYVAKTSKNINNEMIGADVDFTIMYSGASLNNSFAYYDPNVSNASVEITGGDGTSTIDKTNNIVRLANQVLNYANKPNKVTFTVKYKYNSPIPASSYKGAPFNPFITVGNISGGNDTGKEIHLTNYPPTAVADMSWFEKKTADRSNPEMGLYYITYQNFNAKPGEDKGQQLPFAVNILFDKEATMNGFKVTQEGKNISKAYTGFNSWVSSNGTDNPDWYLHYSE